MRSTIIIARLLPFVLSFLRDRRRWLVAGRPAVRTAEFHRHRAARFVATLAALGPTFVKLAQVFAARADLVPEPYLTALGTLTDQVPPVPYEAVEAVIAESYGGGASVASLFERFDRVPLAAASLGQVHRARYRGEEVVVKVLRPGVEALVASDVRAARRILDPLARRWPNRHVVALRTVVAEFSHRVYDEMDFRKEAAHAAAIRRNFAGRTSIVVPRVVDEMTRQHVLVLEYMEGRRIDRIEEWIAERRVDPRAIVRTVMELYIQMMLVDGLFHADPHPGNLLVSPRGQLIVLDFGMVVRVPRETRLELVNTVFAAIRKDVDRIIGGFQALGIIEPDADLAQIRDLAHRLLALAEVRATVQEKLDMMLADEIMHELYDAPVTLPSDMVYFARTAALIEGLGTRYDPYFNAVEFATPLALRMHGRIMSSLRGDQPSVAGTRSDDWASALGGFLGSVAGAFVRGAREMAAAFAEAQLDARPLKPATATARVLPPPAPPVEEAEGQLALPAAR
jgi:predicted unusual protein kinase regulating ubiquinone biosynthesis (AarF/ABC1/UbiB family)